MNFLTSFIKKHKIELICFSVLIVLFFLTRLFRIETLPLFTDEAIYVRWSQIARYDAAWRFISLTDGKQPSFVWVAMNIMRFVDDPLLASRYVSVLSGFLGLIGMYFLAKETFKNRWVGIIASFLYLFYPMALVYDRMALYDSFVFMSAVWALYFEVLLVRRIKLDIALILGMVLGVGMLTKSSAAFFIYLFPFVFLLFDLKKGLKSFIKLVLLSMLSVFMAYGYYSILRLSPFFHIIKDKNSIFVFSIKEWMEKPFEFFNGNLSGQFNWLQNYMTWPILMLIIFGTLFSFKKFYKEKIILLAWCLLPFVALALLGKVLYPRFILFMTMPLLLLASFSLYFVLQKIKKVHFRIALMVVLFGLMLRADYFVLTDFANAPIPESDSGQYINGWPAGGGVKEIVSFLDKESKKGKIYVATEGTFGSLPTYAIEIYLGDNRNVEKAGVWPLPDEVPKDLVEKAKKMPVYFVFNSTQVYKNNTRHGLWPMDLIAKYQKGTGDTYMSLYKIRKPQ